MAVGELSGGTHLALEATGAVGVAHELLADDLEGDQGAQLAVAGPVDLTHAAFPQPVQEDIGAEHQVRAVFVEELVDLVGVSQPC
jgi:hypothetical protein